MNYPDGSLIRTGDLIWWDYGAGTGYVGEIMEDQKAYDAWGLEEPSLELNNVHPFDGSSGGMVYPLWVLEIEGLRKFSDPERQELELALGEASQRAGRSFEGLKYVVRAGIENCKQVTWIFILLGDDWQAIERIVVPRPPESLPHPVPV
ncbi:hypothetical protein [Luteolibacter sp. Populi]|uniref:hypothetical protein n=1 Tax=Luteolibacter sp. Populi TaxID=3230487 RepID=UPI003466E9C6